MTHRTISLKHQNETRSHLKQRGESSCLQQNASDSKLIQCLHLNLKRSEGNQVQTSQDDFRCSEVDLLLQVEASLSVHRSEDEITGVMIWFKSCSSHRFLFLHLADAFIINIKANIKANNKLVMVCHRVLDWSSSVLPLHASSG